MRMTRHNTVMTSKLTCSYMLLTNGRGLASHLARCESCLRKLEDQDEVREQLECMAADNVYQAR